MISNGQVRGNGRNYKYTHTQYSCMAGESGKQPCPVCGLKGRVRVRVDKTLVCGDCGYDSRNQVEQQEKKQ